MSKVRSGWVCARCGCSVYKVSMYDPVRVPHNRVFYRHFANRYIISCGMEPVLMLRTDYEAGLSNVTVFKSLKRGKPLIRRRATP